jgi:hypothetical protein
MSQIDGASRSASGADAAGSPPGLPFVEGRRADLMAQ